jgi:Mn-containing catalase
MNTAAEELGHIEMLATAVAMNLEGAPLKLKEEIAADPIGGAVLALLWLPPVMQEVFVHRNV